MHNIPYSLTVVFLSFEVKSQNSNVFISDNMTSLEREFEDFFNSLAKQQFAPHEIQHICKPLRNYYRYEKLKLWLKIGLLFGLLYALFIMCDSINWSLSAIGRLCLIQLLPYWNWAELYNAKCLVNRVVDVKENTVAINELGHYETEKENCLLCDTIDYIPSLSNTTYKFLESTYLERSFPVVVTDSHQALSLDDIYQLIFNNSFDFLRSNPCDVSTNLMMNKFFDVEIALRKAWNLNHSSDKWFLQLRNCQFKAVKSSRNFIKRPYYYPGHLEPYYSSWLIISHNYSQNKYQREILLHGLIIVQQLWGSMDLSLNAKEPCLNCPVINVRLKERESLIFSTELWMLSYKFVNDRRESVATIMEIDWNI